MDYDEIRAEIKNLWENACKVHVHCAFIAWHDIFGMTSIRSMYANEGWEAHAWMDERLEQYKGYEYYAWMDGDMVSYSRG